MPAIIRKSFPAIVEARREIYNTITWHVRAGVWSPPTDIYETETQFVVRLELAGVQESDFTVTVEQNVLVISGQRPDQNERRAYHQMEIRFGRFEVAVEIPPTVEVEGATAEYKSGLLMVLLPKKQPHRNTVE